MEAVTSAIEENPEKMNEMTSLNREEINNLVKLGLKSSVFQYNGTIYQ